MPTNVQPKPTVATFTLSSEGTGVAQTVKVGGSAHQFNVMRPPRSAARMPRRVRSRMHWARSSHARK